MAKNEAAGVVDEIKAEVRERMKPFKDLDAGHLAAKLQGFIREATGSRVEDAIFSDLIPTPKKAE